MIHTDGKPTIASRTEPVDGKKLSRAKNVRTESEVRKLREKLFGLEK